MQEARNGFSAGAPKGSSHADTLILALVDTFWTLALQDHKRVDLC